MGVAQRDAPSPVRRWEETNKTNKIQKQTNKMGHWGGVEAFHARCDCATAEDGMEGWLLSKLRDVQGQGLAYRTEDQRVVG